MSATTTQKRPMQRDPDAAQAALVALYNRLVLLVQNNILFSATSPVFPVCAIATVTSQVKTTNACQYRVDGTMKTKAATDNLWTLAPAANVLAVSSFRKYLLLIDSAGTATVFQSNDSTVSAAACTWNFSATPLPFDGKAVFGVLTVATNSATTFTPATTLLGAAGITSTFVDGWDNSVCPIIADMGNNIVSTGLY